MSFILDALKKSENERQRGDAPALHEMKMAPPRQGVATWLIVLAGLLAINIVVLCVVLLRGTHGATPAVDAGNTPATVPAAVPGAGPAAVAAPAPAPTVITPSPAPVNPPAMAQEPPVAAQAPATTDDDAPAVEPPRGATGGPPQSNSQSGVQATGGNSGELPTYQQAATAPGANLPELALNLHSYSANPADRFVFLNMIKLREGQATPQGVRVETITPDGAVLSWQGSKFLLQRQ
jgi:general secretion pathway protein B